MDNFIILEKILKISQVLIMIIIDQPLFFKVGWNIEQRIEKLVWNIWWTIFYNYFGIYNLKSLLFIF